MTRKEIVFLTGRQILAIMIILGNALVIGLMIKYHSFEVFKMEDDDLTTFTIAQRNERDVKEEIRLLEGKKTWNETDYAKKNLWSSEENNSPDKIKDLIK